MSSNSSRLGEAACHGKEETGDPTHGPLLGAVMTLNACGTRPPREKSPERRQQPGIIAGTPSPRPPLLRLSRIPCASRLTNPSHHRQSTRHAIGRGSTDGDAE